MLEESLAFRSIATDHQNRFSDRLSFLYLEYSRIVQSSHGVVALRSTEEHGPVESEIQLPVGSLALLSLGPGTSITNAALTSCARSGCVVQISGGGGFPSHSTISSLTTSSKWAIAQATASVTPTEAKRVAKKFYAKQFGIDSLDGSITQMRGIEGTLVRKLYASEAKRQKIAPWKRDTRSDDNVNRALNVANGILYGLCASLVGALSMSPALGIIHRGNDRAFIFDLADLYKPSVGIPIAFSMANEDPDEVAILTRRALRREIISRSMLKDMAQFVTDTFSPYLPEFEGDRLIGQFGEVEGHVNYAKN